MKVLSGFLALTFLIGSFSLHAFTMNNSAKLAFAQDEVVVNVAAGFCQNLGISDATLLALVGTAVDKFWNKAPNSRLRLRQGSLVNVSANYKTDSICEASTNCTPRSALAVASDILISCNTNNTNFPTTAILGVTIPNNISGGLIIGSLIVLNDNSGNQLALKNNDEKTSIIAHELGHAIGLGHSPVEDSLMYYATRDKRQSLGRDDFDGVAYLYPKKEPIASCGSIDLNRNPPPGSWWGSLMIGLFLILIFDLGRKKIKLYT